MFVVRERAFTETIVPLEEFLESAMVGRDVDETVLMEKAPATSGKPARWLIRQGNYITLGELFVLGAHRCSEEAVCLSNAKRNRQVGSAAVILGRYTPVL